MFGTKSNTIHVRVLEKDERDILFSRFKTVADFNRVKGIFRLLMLQYMESVRSHDALKDETLSKVVYLVLTQGKREIWKIPNLDTYDLRTIRNEDVYISVDILMDEQIHLSILEEHCEKRDGWTTSGLRKSAERARIIKILSDLKATYKGNREKYNTDITPRVKKNVVRSTSVKGKPDTVVRHADKLVRPGATSNPAVNTEFTVSSSNTVKKSGPVPVNLFGNGKSTTPSGTAAGADAAALGQENNKGTSQAGAANTTASVKDSDSPKVSTHSNQKLVSLLNELAGMNISARAKDEIRAIVESLKIKNKDESEAARLGRLISNLIFLGERNTGKIKAATLVARIYKELGILSKGHIVMVRKSDLVGNSMGETEHKTIDIIRDARGGLLYIEDAHSLHVGYGQGTLRLLLRAMENKKDRVTVVMAGRSDLIEVFMASNPGLRARFGGTIHFN